MNHYDQGDGPKILSRSVCTRTRYEYQGKVFSIYNDGSIRLDICGKEIWLGAVTEQQAIDAAVYFIEHGIPNGACVS